MNVVVIAAIVAVSYFIGKNCGVGVGTATYLVLLMLYKKINGR